MTNATQRVSVPEFYWDMVVNEETVRPQIVVMDPDLYGYVANSWAEQAFGVIVDSYRAHWIASSCPQTHEGYWVEPENQKRENCFYCGGALVKKGDYLICEECDKR